MINLQREKINDFNQYWTGKPPSLLIKPTTNVKVVLDILF